MEKSDVGCGSGMKQAMLSYGVDCLRLSPRLMQAEIVGRKDHVKHIESQTQTCIIRRYIIDGRGPPVKC